MTDKMDVIRADDAPVEVVRTLDVIAVEIRSFTASMLNNAIEVGRRFVEAKEMLSHGEFGTWVKKNTPYSISAANTYMHLFREYSSPQGSLFGAEVKSQTYANLNLSQAVALLQLPRGEREEFIEEHQADEMSVRALKKAVQERKDALKAMEEAKASAAAAEESRAKIETDMRMAQELLATASSEKDSALAEVENLKKQIYDLEHKPVEVAVQEPDPAVVAKAVDDALSQERERYQKELADIQAELDKEVAENNKLEKRLSKMKKDTREVDKAERLQLEEEVAKLKKQLIMAGSEVTTFKFHFAAWQQTYARMMEALEAVPELDRAKLQVAVTAQMESWQDSNGG